MKKLQFIFIAALLFFSLHTTALAAGSELRVLLKDDANAPAAGIHVELIQVAAGGKTSAVLTEDFSAVGLSTEQLAANDGAARAQTLYQYVLSHNLTGQTAVSSSAGEAVFSGLGKGLYLVFERGGQEVTFLPYLVWLSGSAVTSEPKVEESGSKSLTVSKIWDDGNDADGLRPDMVTVTLFRNGNAFRKVSLSAANGWRHTFSNLPDTGAYEVKETAVDGYTVSYTQTKDGFLITNHHQNSAPDAVSVTVQKVWDDKENAAGMRPESITVQLLEHNVVVETAVLSGSNEWMTSFSGLKADGDYSVLEIPVSGYTASYSGDPADGFMVTNKYTEASIDPQPIGPTIPQTGAYMYSTYLLFAAGVILVLLGTAVLRWERRKK